MFSRVVCVCEVLKVLDSCFLEGCVCVCEVLKVLDSCFLEWCVCEILKVLDLCFLEWCVYESGLVFPRVVCVEMMIW